MVTRLGVTGAFPSLVLFAREFDEKSLLRGWLCGCVRAPPQVGPLRPLTGLSFGFAQVCDEPHPLLVKEMVQHCVNANVDEAYKVCVPPPSLTRGAFASSAERREASLSVWGLRSRALLPSTLRMRLGVGLMPEEDTDSGRLDSLL